MASKKDLKKYFFNKKSCSIILALFFAVGIFSGIKAVYALYSNYTSNGILANKVGDFDFIENTPGLIFYKEDINGKFVRSYSIPSPLAYEFDSTLTRCTNTCVYSLTQEDYDCYYSYDIDNNRFLFTSSNEVMCKFYFKELYDFDINLSVMVQDENGTEQYLNSNYKEMFAIPAFGYEYNGYRCENGSIVEYDSESNSFIVDTNGKENCKVYFVEKDQKNVTISIYIQKSAGSNEYEQVMSIPSGFNYTLNEDTVCYNTSDEEVNMSGLISFDNGYISINSLEILRCVVKLDIANQ